MALELERMVINRTLKKIIANLTIPTFGVNEQNLKVSHQIFQILTVLGLYVFSVYTVDLLSAGCKLTWGE